MVHLAVERGGGQNDEALETAGAERGAAAVVAYVARRFCDADYLITAGGEHVERVGVVILRKLHGFPDVFLGERARVGKTFAVSLRHTPRNQQRHGDVFRHRHEPVRLLGFSDRRHRVDAVRPFGILHAVKLCEGRAVTLRQAKARHELEVEHAVIAHIFVHRALHGGLRAFQPREDAHAQRHDRKYRKVAPQRGSYTAEQHFQTVLIHLTTQYPQPGLPARSSRPTAPCRS